jgi:hypothetical protein
MIGKIEGTVPISASGQNSRDKKYIQTLMMVKNLSPLTEYVNRRAFWIFFPKLFPISADIFI